MHVYKFARTLDLPELTYVCAAAFRRLPAET